jgi:hypothetical protein
MAHQMIHLMLELPVRAFGYVGELRVTHEEPTEVMSGNEWQ